MIEDRILHRSSEGIIMESVLTTKRKGLRGGDPVQFLSPQMTFLVQV
jgi:hypothetical protein